MAVNELILPGVAGLAFLVGLLAGTLLLSARARQWRRRFEDERAHYADYRTRAETLSEEQGARLRRLEAAEEARARSEAEASLAAAPPAPVPPPPPEQAPAPSQAPTEPAPLRAEAAADAALPLAVAPDAPPAEGAPLAFAPSPAPIEASEAAPLSDKPEWPVAPLPAAEPDAAPAPAEAIAEPAAENPPPVPTPHPLTRLTGLDPAIAGQLDQLGIKTLHDIETLSAEDEMALELRLGLPAGYMTRHQWRLQAALLGTAQDAR